MAKKIKKYKVGMNSETYAISMVEAPAIEENFVSLAKEEEEKKQVFLEANEKHMVYGAVLVPDRDIYRNNGENEFYLSFSKESIEKMSQDFMKEYRQHEVKTDHEDIANEVCVVETWLKADQFKDKSVALGLNDKLPVGTWFAGMKVNNVETWNRIKNGELKGFSVESMISLEDFEKQNSNNMTIETNEMFFDKLKNVIKEIFSQTTIREKESDIEPVNIEDLEAQTETAVETPVAEEPKVEEPEEPKVEEVTLPPLTPEEKEKIEEEIKSGSTEDVKPDNHLEDLVNSLKQEIEALKELNSGLKSKVKELSKEPSAKPVNVNAKPSKEDTYSAWREKMRSYIG